MSNAPDQARPRQPRPKQNMSGCMLAVIIVGSLMLLGAIAVTMMVVLALRTSEGTAVVDIIKTCFSWHVQRRSRLTPVTYRASAAW